MFKKLNKNLKLNKPDAVLIDTDNTLYDYAPANQKALIASKNKLNNLLGVNESDFFRLYRQARIEIKKELGDVASSHSRLLYFQRLIELLGFKAQLMIALDLEQTFWRTFLANAPLFPGVKDFLNSLKNNNVPIAIVTDLTAHIQLRKLTYFNLEDTFDAVVTSEEAGADKPDLRNFKLVLKKLNLNDPNNVWMIGDNPKTDIIGGKMFGAKTFQKIHKGVTIGIDLEKPDFVFNSFLEINRYFLSFVE